MSSKKWKRLRLFQELSEGQCGRSVVSQWQIKDGEQTRKAERGL